MKVSPRLGSATSGAGARVRESDLQLNVNRNQMSARATFDRLEGHLRRNAS